MTAQKRRGYIAAHGEWTRRARAKKADAEMAAAEMADALVREALAGRSATEEGHEALSECALALKTANDKWGWEDVGLILKELVEGIQPGPPQQGVSA